MVHPDTLGTIENELNFTENQSITEPITVNWSEESTIHKKCIGPFIVKNIINGKSIVTFLTSTEPEYMVSLRKKSISLSVRDRQNLDFELAPASVEIISSPNPKIQFIRLVPVDYYYGGGGDEDEGEEEE